MPKYSQVKGLPVVTKTDGKKVGNVDELLLDPEAKTVHWIGIHSGGLFGERRWVLADTVHGLEGQVVTIAAESDLRAPGDVPAATNLMEGERPLIGTPVITEAGQHLGQARDYEFSAETLSLVSVLVPQGNLFNSSTLAIPADRVLTLGKDVIIVANEVAAGPVDESAADDARVSGDAADPA